MITEPSVDGAGVGAGVPDPPAGSVGKIGPTDGVPTLGMVLPEPLPVDGVVVGTPGFGEPIHEFITYTYILIVFTIALMAKVA